MSTSSSRSRRRHAAARHESHKRKEPALLSAAWSLLVKPHIVGALLCGAGGLLMVAPLLKAPKRLSASWWSGGLEDANLLMFVAVLLALAGPLLIGLWWQRRLEERGEAERASADMLLSDPPELKSKALAMVPWLGVALMLMGSLVGVGCWFSLFRDVLPTQAAISVGQPTEFVRAKVSAEPLRLMLPRRVTISDVRMAAPQSVTLTFALPKQTDAKPQTLSARESIDVAGKRFTFIGLINDPQQLRVVLKGTDERSIEATGRVGELVRTSLEGPQLEVKQITRNYLGAMGPAVQLSSEQTGTFWLFERQVDPKYGPPFDQGLKLVRLETLPAAVFMVGPELPFWPLVLAVILFVLGAGALLGFEQLSLMGRGRRLASSLHEAGRWAESFESAQGQQAQGSTLAGEEE